MKKEKVKKSFNNIDEILKEYMPNHRNKELEKIGNSGQVASRLASQIVKSFRIEVSS